MGPGMIKGVVLEVCVDSVESAVAAQVGGADRVELCDNLLEGGTTPSAGAIEVARSGLSIGLHILVRPRGGDFCYSPTEVEVMRRDIVRARELGADGVVVGILTPDGAVNTGQMAELIGLARPLSVTFHRAFDMARDPFETLEQLIALKVERVLTSGQAPSALEGLPLLAELVRVAGDRIIVMPGGGAGRDLQGILDAVAVQEVHVSGRTPVDSPMRWRNPQVHMGSIEASEYTRMVTSGARIGELRRIVDGHRAAAVSRLVQGLENV